MNLHELQPEKVFQAARLVFQEKGKLDRAVSSSDKSKPETPTDKGQTTPGEKPGQTPEKKEDKKEVAKKVSSIDIRNAARGRANKLLADPNVDPKLKAEIKTALDKVNLDIAEGEKKDVATANEAAGELMAILQEADPNDTNLKYWHTEASNDANTKIGVEKMRGVNKAKAAAQKSKDAVIKILKEAGFGTAIPAENAGQKAMTSADALYDTDHQQAKTQYETAKAEFDKYAEALKLTIKAKETADKALAALPDNIVVFDTPGKSVIYAFTAKTRADSSINTEYNEAKAMVNSDPAKAKEKYEAAEKKYRETLGQVNRLTNLSNDINNYAVKQEEFTQNGTTQREINQGNLNRMMTSVYAAARDFAYDADASAIDKVFSNNDSGTYNFYGSFDRLRNSYYATTGYAADYSKKDEQGEVIREKVVFQTTPGEEKEAIIPEPPKVEPTVDAPTAPETPQPQPVANDKPKVKPKTWVDVVSPTPAPLDLPEVPELKLQMPTLFPTTFPNNLPVNPAPAPGDSLEDHGIDEDKDKPQASNKPAPKSKEGKG